VPSSLYAHRLKRALDLLLALSALAVLSPLWLLIALLIRLDSPGPVFYRQERIGRHGQPFRLFKFRSMVQGAERKGAGILVEKDDARVTRVGRLLRKLSLDEIPQLFNVVSGDMSLVGPRPGLRYQAEQYDDLQRRRLLVRPGVTGWAQVHGRNAIDWGRRIELDLEYIDRLSLATDLLVLLKTVPSVLRAEGQIADRDYWLEKKRQRESGSSRGGGGHAG
jgi:lipopolysaccharide/colanic/teichoic acid biosynthesis glycosyltransferase